MATAPYVISELVLRNIASTQRGLFTTRQSLEAGWSRQRLQRWLRSGRIARVHARVYLFAGWQHDWMTDLLAAVLACGEGAAASHRSAMALHGIEPARREHRGPMSVSVPAARDAKVPGVTVHRVILTTTDVTRVDGIPCTTYERTLLDSAARLGRDPHRTRTKFDADHRRDRLLTLAGWSILYFTSASSAVEIVEHIARLRTTSPRG